MKKAIVSSLVVASLGLGGCATTMPLGAWYTNVKLPVTATANDSGMEKTGTASCRSILSLFATGDCSLEAAMKNGHITKVTHVDWEAHNVLGIVGNYKLTVYGK